MWLINDHLRLEAVPPEPRLIYTVNDQLDFFAGGELLGDAYKRDHTDFARPANSVSAAGSLTTAKSARARG